MFFVVRLFLSILVAFGLAFFLHQKEIQRTSRYDNLIQQSASRWKVDPALVKAVIWRETNFNSDQLGQAQERGLMQVTPIAAQEWAERQEIKNFRVDQLFYPETNIEAGTWYLAQAIRRWKERDNPLTFALAEYNAGRVNALRWSEAANPISSEEFLNRITFPTTKHYIKTTLVKYDFFRAQHAQR